MMLLMYYVDHFHFQHRRKAIFGPWQSSDSHIGKGSENKNIKRKHKRKHTKQKHQKETHIYLFNLEIKNLVQMILKNILSENEVSIIL